MLITTPIFYTNDSPHIGHAYTCIMSDILRRGNESCNQQDVFLSTGTDEHGQKIEQATKQTGQSPQDFVDEKSLSFKEMMLYTNIKYDEFVRTSSYHHKKIVLSLYNKMKEQGDIYLAPYSGYYHTADERFLTEGEYESLKGTKEEKYIEYSTQDNLFFRLSKYILLLLEFYQENPNWIPDESRRNEILSQLKRGFHDLSISRTNTTWGISVPDMPGHVFYVWIDALANYISVLSDDEFGKGFKFEKFWTEENVVHLIGKDISTFHAVYWPAMLISAFNLQSNKDSLRRYLPKILVHGWWTVNDEKMSKRLKNVVDPKDLVSKYGEDRVRWFLAREMRFGEDGDFSEDKLKIRCNAELTNTIGNLVHRTIGLFEKYGNNHFLSHDREMTLFDDNRFSSLFSIENYSPNESSEMILNYARKFNRYIDDAAPWNLFKEQKYYELSKVIGNLYVACRIIGIKIYPFCPSTSDKILNIFNMSGLNKPTAHLFSRL